MAKKIQKLRRLSATCCVCAWVLSLAWFAIMPFLPGLAASLYLGYVPVHLWPSNLDTLLRHYGPEQRRHIGHTALANASRYPKINVSQEELNHYFKHGWVHLKNVLPAEPLQELREHLLVSGVPLWPWSINRFTTSDDLLDFLLFGSLGDVASQFFGGKNASLFSDFMYWRAPMLQVTGWHFDSGECEYQLLPAKDTKRSRLRVWVTLDDDVPVPTFLDQSYWEEALPADELVQFKAGTLVPEKPTEEDMAYYYEKSDEAMVNASTGSRHLVYGERARLGDVVVHSPCLVHSSPEFLENRTVGFLCPTFQEEDSRYHFCSHCSPALASRECDSGLKPGDSMVGNSCFPRVHPSPEHLRGTDLDFHYTGTHTDGNRIHWLKGFIGRRMGDLMSFPGYNAFVENNGYGRPFTAGLCKVINGFMSHQFHFFRLFF